MRYGHVLLLLFITGSLFSQQFDAQLEQLAARYDTAAYARLALQKAASARQSNDLIEWQWTFVDFRDLVEQDHPRALQIVESALTRRWREPQHSDEWEPVMYLLADKGWHLFHLGDVLGATQAYEQARNLYEQYHFPDFDAVESLYKPLGNHYTRLGDNDKALRVFETALPLTSATESLAGLYNNIATAHWNAGRYKQAMQAVQQGLDLPGLSPQHRSMLQAVQAQILLNPEQPEQLVALDLIEKALKVPQTDPVRRGRMRRTAGDACFLLKFYDQAQYWFKLALDDFQKSSTTGISRDIGKTCAAISETYTQQRKGDAALQWADRALKAVLPGFNPDRNYSNPAATQFYSEITIVEALSAKADAADLQYNLTGDRHWLLLALDCHDLADMADKTLRKVLQYPESQLGLAASAHQRTDNALQIARKLYDLGDMSVLSRAFDLAERAKATLLTQAVQDNLVWQQRAGDPLIEQVTTLRRSVGDYERQLITDAGNVRAGQWKQALDRLRQQLYEAEQTLRKQYPSIQQAAAALIDFSRLPPSETLLEYWEGASHWHVFMAEHTGLKSWLLVKKDSQVVHFQRYFSHADAILNAPAGYLQTAWQLYDQLNLAAAQNARSLLIIPDGALLNLPFEALVTAPADGFNLRTAPYLIKSQTVRYAWSAATWQMQEQYVAHPDEGFLGIAPGFAHGERQLPPLSQQSEWAYFKTDHRTELKGDQATRQAVLRQINQPAVLHFYTHANAATVAPRIELIDDALLLPDIYAMHLRADLVVLSACQTGIGVYREGEGVMSLARAFAQAGAANVLSSMWSVNDAATGQIMAQFYAHWNDKTPVSVALRNAKLDYINDPEIPASRQSPWYWAAMIPVGADRTGPAAGWFWWWWGIVATGIGIWGVYRIFLR